MGYLVGAKHLSRYFTEKIMADAAAVGGGGGGEMIAAANAAAASMKESTQASAITTKAKTESESIQGAQKAQGSAAEKFNQMQK